MKNAVYSVALLFSLFSVNIVLGQSCGVIYVTPTGASSGAAGTKTNPASLAYGLTLATGTYNRIWLASGTYNITQSLQLVSNTTIEGGFDAVAWIKSNATPSIIHRDNNNIIPAPANALIALAGNAISNFRLQDLTILVDNATAPQTSVYGVYLNGCSDYNVVRCNITTGSAGAGTNGVNGANGGNGGNGGAGIQGCHEACIPAGGLGGVGGGVNNNGGNGGTGGRWANYAPANGQAGSCGAAGGTRGTGPGCGCGLFGTSQNNSCSGTSPTAGAAATGTGSPGVNGANGALGTITGGYFVPGPAGGNGTVGGDGCGGGGGGGGGGRQQDGNDDVGGSGGGGGGGGGGGAGGTGGTGGGGSFAVFLFNNGVNGSVVDCALTAGAGGVGGSGGVGGAGGAGGAGGNGGATGPYISCGFANGAAGGAGRPGGAGGNGGNGANGLSQALSETGGVSVAQSNITSVPGNPPVISVDNSGCTNSQIAFSSAAPGAWDFGSGANPATGNGTNATVIYNTAGRKTIIYEGTIFTDYVDIFSDFSSGSITHTSNPAVIGCPDTFSTPIVGSSYTWIFGAAQPTTVTSTSPSAATAFLVTGTQTVYVQVTTACCGIVTDSLVVNIQPNTINVSLAASADTICSGNSITYTASPAGYLGYGFLVNGIIQQQSASNTFTTTGLTQGDSVMVVAFDGVCYSNPSAIHYPTILSVPAATLVSSDADNTICAGETVTFTASPTGYDTYIFSDGSTQVQSSSSDSYLTSSLVAGNAVTVAIAHGGCTGAASAVISTTVNPIPVISLAAVTTICQGDNATITANPSGLSNYVFSVNGSEVQNSATNSYSSSLLNNGDIVSVTVTNLGCVSQPQTVTFTVNPIPFVTLSSSEADNAICQNETVTFTASPAGYDNYIFFNGSVQIQNSASEVYSTNSLATGNSITVTTTNLGCTSPPSSPIITVIDPAPIVEAGSNWTACVNASPIPLTPIPEGGVWTGQNVSPSGVFTPIASGIFNLFYSYTDPNTGCTGYDSLRFVVNALPIVVASASPPTICEGESAVLNVSGAENYAWSPENTLQNTTSSSPTATPILSTIYTVTAADINGCSSVASVNVTVNPKPDADFSAAPVCSGTPMTFINTTIPAGDSYLWDFGNGNTSVDSAPVYTYSNHNSYLVTLIARLGNCYDTVQQTVTTVEGVTADFFADPTNAYDRNSPILFTDRSRGEADTWQWYFGDNTASEEATPTHQYAQEGIYTITLIASNRYNCIDTVIKPNYIRIYPAPVVYVPNAFTPNNDNVNDILKVYANGVKTMEWHIYNRWGEKVYYSNDIEEGWDGTYKGNYVSPGVYVYSLNITYRDATFTNIRGSITVIR